MIKRTKIDNFEKFNIYNKKIEKLFDKLDKMNKQDKCCFWNYIYKNNLIKLRNNVDEINNLYSDIKIEYRQTCENEEHKIIIIEYIFTEQLKIINLKIKSY